MSIDGDPSKRAQGRVALVFDDKGGQTRSAGQIAYKKQNLETVTLALSQKNDQREGKDKNNGLDHLLQPPVIFRRSDQGQKKPLDFARG